MADEAEGMCLKCLLATAAAPRGDQPVEFGGYMLGRRLGAGGMGLVYEATQTELNRRVALKVLAPGLFASREARERFQNEAQAIARLDHPNIVPVYEVGEEDGQPFFSMRLIAGGSLADHLRQDTRDSERRCAQVLFALARAVHYAHQRGVLHRDLKPANVLLDEDGNPWLADFGLARLIGRDSLMSGSRSMIGTPAYMAPEQAGARGEITTAVDVYGLGAILYEMLGGRPPFHGASTILTLRQVVDMEPQRLSTLRPGLARDLETICLKCLAKNPKDRYASAAALSDDLERWLTHKPILARPTSWSEITWKWMRRHPGSAAVLLAIVSIACVSTVLSLRLAKAERAATTEADMRRGDLVRAYTAEADRLITEGDTTQAMLWQCQALTLEEKAAPGPDRDTSIAHARTRMTWITEQVPRLHQLWTADAAFNAASFSRDGTQLALAHGRAVRVVDPVTGAQTMSALSLPGEIESVLISPAGTHLAAMMKSRHAAIIVISSARIITSTLSCTAPEMSFSPSGDRLLLGTQKGPCWHSITGAQSTSVEAGPALHLALSPDGHHIAWSSGTDFLLRDAASGVDRKLRQEQPESLRHIAWSRDSSRVLFVKSDGGIRQHLAVSGEKAGKPLQPGTACFKAMYHPDGTRILSIGPRVTKLWDAQTGHGVSSDFPPELTTDATINASGTHLAIAGAGGMARLWRQARSQPGSPWLHHASGITQIHFSPVTDHVLTLSSDHTARLWIMPVEIKVAPFAHAPGQVQRLHLTADASQLHIQLQDGKVTTWSLSEKKWLPHAKATLPPLDPLLSPDAHQRLHIKDTQVSVQPGPLPALQHSATVLMAMWSPDGQIIATSGKDQAVRLWSARDGAPAAAALRHADAVSALAFLPDGKSIATGSDDQTVRVWNTRTGAVLTRSFPHRARIAAITATADGSQLITADADGLLYQWPLVQAPEPRSRLQALAELLSAHRLDPQTGLTGLDAQEIIKRWQP